MIHGYQSYYREHNLPGWSPFCGTISIPLPFPVAPQPVGSAALLLLLQHKVFVQSLACEHRHLKDVPGCIVVISVGDLVTCVPDRFRAGQVLQIGLLELQRMCNKAMRAMNVRVAASLTRSR